MVPDLEKPRVTEIQVRMDCNGCVQKIKKALNGINGIYDLYIDFPKQKLTIVGWADPEKIVKAIKKTRKIATICSHTESTEQPPPAAPAAPAPAPEATSEPPAPEAPNPPPPEAPSQEAAGAPPPAETTKEPPPPQPSEKNNTNQAPDQGVPPQPEVPPSTSAPKPAPRDVEEIHIIHHHPHNYGVYDDHPWSSSSTSTIHPGSSSRGIFRHEAVPPYYHVTHSYNTHRPSPYVTEYEYRRSPPRTVRYGRTEQYYHVDDYQVRGNGNGNGADGNNITSIFSDENPNACRIA